MKFPPQRLQFDNDNDFVDLVNADDSSPLQGISKSRKKCNNHRVFDDDTSFSDEESVEPGTDSCSGIVIDLVESSENVEKTEHSPNREVKKNRSELKESLVQYFPEDCCADDLLDH